MASLTQRITELEAQLAERDAQLAQRDATIAKLLARIDELEAKVALLTKELEETKSKGKRQANPFSKNKPKQNPKRPGRKKGKGKWSHRQTPTPEQVTETKEVRLSGCPDCGSPLQDLQEYEQYNVDIPPVTPIITKIVTESGHCPCCDKRVQSQVPEGQVSPGGASSVNLGPRLRALAADLHHRLGLSWAKVADLLKEAFGAEVSRSGLYRSDLRLARELESVYQELIEVLRQSTVAHVDETGWRIGMLSAWLWVFTNQEVTIYTIEESRGHEVVIEILGKEFKGTLVSDRFLAYDHKELENWLKQKCMAHLLRNLSDLAENKTKGAVRFARAVSKLLREAIALKKEEDNLSAKKFKRKRKDLEKRLDALITENRKFSDRDNARMAKQLRKQRQHLLRFLYDKEVPTTNDQAERQIRPAVIIRKTGGCNRSYSGAFAHSVLGSIAATCKQRAISVLNFFETCQKALNQLPSLLQQEPEPG